MSVLVAIHHIQRRIDPTLAARWNCKAAKCGSCAAEVNGKPRLMCKTLVEEFHGEIEVKPMKTFPLIKDLVTDVTGMWNISRKVPPFTPRKTGETVWRMFPEDIERSMEFKKCIECFICQDICHVLREHKVESYIGPRFMIKATWQDMHPFDSLDRSRFLHNEGGMGYCNITKCCQDLCPEHISITDNAIIPEKERAADKYYDPIAWVVERLRKKRQRV
ncbi:MAG: succinate dehydrogenase/fumarate reductase iron-sulfur subunit [Candidatus Bathyarchaeia archaeon]